MSSIKTPVRVEPKNTWEILDADGLLCITLARPHSGMTGAQEIVLRDEIICAINEHDDLKAGYEKAVEALRVYAYGVNGKPRVRGITARNTLKELGELEEEEPKTSEP